MFEIIADPKDYGIEALMEGLGAHPIPFIDEERKLWAAEIGKFAGKLDGLSDRARNLHGLLAGDEAISATPSSLKTLKIQLFNINSALESSISLAEKL
jgi:hypothetical protein